MLFTDLVLEQKDHAHKAKLHEAEKRLRDAIADAALLEDIARDTFKNLRIEVANGQYVVEREQDVTKIILLIGHTEKDIDDGFDFKPGMGQIAMKVTGEGEFIYFDRYPNKGPFMAYGHGITAASFHTIQEATLYAVSGVDNTYLAMYGKGE